MTVKSVIKKIILKIQYTEEKQSHTKIMGKELLVKSLNEKYRIIKKFIMFKTANQQMTNTNGKKGTTNDLENWNKF